MLTDLLQRVQWLIDQGGFMMIPLIALSLLSVTLIIERSWYWFGAMRGATGLTQLPHLNAALRAGRTAEARRLVDADRTPAAEMARALLEHGATDAVAQETAERLRPRLDRFMVLLSTIITAAPMLGILGTVIGIIQSFRLLDSVRTLQDPGQVADGIASALLTTALGLIIALVTLFPYMIFRSRADQTMGRLESVVASAQQPAATGARDGNPAA